MNVPSGLFRSALLLLCAGITGQLIAQHRPGLLECDTSNGDIRSYPEEVRKLLHLRALGQELVNTTSLFAEPSTVSSGIFPLLGSGHGMWSPLENTINTDPHRDKAPYIINGDIQPVVELGGKRWLMGSRTWKDPVLFAVHVLPRFKVRMFANDPDRGDSSYAVRTPSYMPGIELFLTDLNSWNTERSDRRYLAFKAQHHSNGQDGSDGQWTNGYYNTYNGDFSDGAVLDFCVGMVHDIQPRHLEPMRRDTVLEKRVRSKVPSYNRARERGGYKPWMIKGGISWSPFITDTVAPFYGNLRLIASFTRIIAPLSQDLVLDRASGCYLPAEPFTPRERWRFDARFSYVLDRPNAFLQGPYTAPRPSAWYDASKRMNLYATLHYKLRHVPTASIFIQAGYYGTDPYNAYFQESQFFWRIGLGFGNFMSGEPFVGSDATTNGPNTP